MLGFCVYGPKCRLVHLKSVIIDEQKTLEQLGNVYLEQFIKSWFKASLPLVAKTEDHSNEETQTQSNFDSKSTTSHNKSSTAEGYSNKGGSNLI